MRRASSIPVTVIECGPNVVTQIRTDREGRLRGRPARIRNRQAPEPARAGPSQGERIHVARRCARSRPTTLDGIEVGQVIKADTFAAGELVDVTGTSKGRGFQGGVKRHGFRGGPKTHGQSDRWRAPGSIGSSATPGRVFKGMRMAGHMGNERVTVQNLKVLRVDPERNLLLVKGSVPGPNKGLVLDSPGDQGGRSRRAQIVAVRDRGPSDGR